MAQNVDNLVNAPCAIFFKKRVLYCWVECLSVRSNVCSGDQLFYIFTTFFLSLGLSITERGQLKFPDTMVGLLQFCQFLLYGILKLCY